MWIKITLCLVFVFIFYPFLERIGIFSTVNWKENVFHEWEKHKDYDAPSLSADNELFPILYYYVYNLCLRDFWIMIRKFERKMHMTLVIGCASINCSACFMSMTSYEIDEFQHHLPLPKYFILKEKGASMFYQEWGWIFFAT